MRILIKGGVWKNTEDEILKAAVMKYGLNQWARISSLLVRKSAKQCKARWYEWLDPSIKKTEWTREEDEKLLHLAKLMPTQWRTIAPIVGRTPAQCLERYEKLLDAAAAKDESYDPADDPRRLRPGEIDPNPEAKPARPDPVDMDEDEVEMLSEARARLANTRGKKAKRKAREKQLEEARRLASLQKKRELAAAGIDARELKKRSRGIDYNAEVAFEKAAPRGFYDTGEEAVMTKEIGREFRPVTLEEMEGRRRKDIEKNLMKRDAERDARRAAADQPGAVAAALALNDASTARRRGKMMLPAPQVSEAELEAIARGGADGPDPSAADGAGGDTTRRLLGDYATPARFATPMRTPRVLGAGGVDPVTAAAANLARLQAGQTPLAGGENPELHSADFQGVTPRAAVATTPHPLAGMTPRGAGGKPGATPSLAGTPLVGGRRGPGATPARTPARDALGLNEMQEGEGSSVRAGASGLRSGLAGLPAPENEYEISVPELPAEEAPEEQPEEDAADAAARRKRQAAEREAAELKKRSQVLQRGLPRPDNLAALPEPPSAAQLAGQPAEQAEALVQAELLALLQHEAALHPPVKQRRGKRKRGDAPEATAPQGPLRAWQDFPPEELAAASELLAAETAAVHAAVGHSGLADEEFAEAWAAAAGEWIWLPAQQRYARAAGATNSDKVASLQAAHEAALKEMTREAERGAKLERKLEIVTHGYVTRDKGLRASIQRAWSQLQDARTQLACFQRLAQQEQRALPARLAAARARQQRQAEREAQLQQRYKQLLDATHDLD